MIALFAELAWKSSLIAALVLALGAAPGLRGRDRARVLIGGGVLLLMLWPTLLWAPSLSLSVLPAETVSLRAAASPIAPASGAATSDPAGVFVLAIYLAGMVATAARFAVGTSRLGRLAARAETVPPSWIEAWGRLAAADRRLARVRLLRSDGVQAPLSFGLRRPVILLDAATLARHGDADAVLAHEAAHIAHRDWLALALMHAAAALLWFNPLAWLVKGSAVQAMETAADQRATASAPPVRYAQMLVACAGARPSFLAGNALGADRRRLERRITEVLDLQARPAIDRPALSLAALLACTALATPLAALELAAAKPPLPSHRQTALSAAAPRSAANASAEPSEVGPRSARRATAEPAPPIAAATTRARTSAGEIASLQSEIDAYLDEAETAQAEADRLRRQAAAARAMAGTDPGDLGRADGVAGRADAAQGAAHAFTGYASAAQARLDRLRREASASP